MEKLQPILSGLKKHHFWIVCVLAIGAVLAGWYMAWEELPQSFTKNKQEVKRKFEDATKIEIKQIPGQTWPDEAGKRARTLHGELVNAAKKLQAGQENEWPKALGNEFQAAVIKLGRAGKWPPERLEAFQKNAADEVDRLKKLVNPNEGPQAGGVQWDQDDFKQWRDQFVWAAPISPEVMFEAQEKLWVAKAVLQSIVSTNEGATDRFNLPIAAIEVFEIGPGALRNRSARQIEFQGGPAPAAPPPPAAPPVGAPPGAPGAAAPPPKLPAAPPAAPPAALATIKPVSGLRAIPIRIRVKMNPDMLGRLELAMVNVRGVPIIIDDVYFAHDVKLVRERGTREPAAPPAEAAPGGAAAPAAGGQLAPPAAPGAPVGTPAAGVGAAGVGGRAGGGAPGAVAAPGNPGGPGAVEDPAAVPASPPHLVQVPRGSIVEIQATAYFVDMGQVEALKVAMSDKGRL
ncbi:MAG: hypothetical protein K8T91_18550 [Planctomycetes bacterium]|nr:hypothetical protein [Planctomycetota bacterium]